MDTHPGESNPWPLVRDVVVHEELASTSDLARELARDPRLELPLAIRAVRQTRGRGRGSHAWWSDEGSLAVTLILDPRALSLETRHDPLLALATAVAIIAAIERHGPTVAPLGIRWPNDVEADGRKLAGILPERVDGPNPRMLIGIGVNVSTRLQHAPPAIRAMATSVHHLLAPGIGEMPTPHDLLRDVLSAMERVLAQLAAGDPALARRWAELDTLLGAPARVDLGPRVVSGIGRGIDAEGALLLESEGATIPILGGQVPRSPRD